LAEKEQESHKKKREKPKRIWKVFSKSYLFLFVLFLIMFTMRATIIILQVFVPAMSQDFFMTSGDFAIIFTIYTFSGAITSFFVGPIAERVGYKSTIFSGMFFFTIATSVSTFATAFWVIALAQGIAGFSAALFGPATVAFSGDFFPENKQSSVIGFIMSSFYVASILAVPINAFIGELLSWRWAIAIMAILSGVILLLIVLIIPPKKQPKISSSEMEKEQEFDDRKREKPHKLKYYQKMKAVLTQKYALGAFFITLFQRGGLFAMTAILSDWLLIKFGKEASISGLILMGAGIAALISNAFFSWLADKKAGKKSIILFGTALTGLWIGVFALLSFNFGLAIFGVIFLNFLGGISMGSYNAYIANIDAKSKNITVALNNSFGQISQALAVAIIAKVIYKQTGNYTYAGFAAAAFYLIAFILMLFFIKKDKNMNNYSNNLSQTN